MLKDLFEHVAAVIVVFDDEHSDTDQLIELVQSGHRGRESLSQYPLKFPRREALKMDMELIQAAVMTELDLKFDLIASHGQVADRARGADARTAPRAVGGTARQLTVFDYFAGDGAEGFFVHLAVPRERTKGDQARCHEGQSPECASLMPCW
jgi:hypothetical protein